MKTIQLKTTLGLMAILLFYSCQKEGQETFDIINNEGIEEVFNTGEVYMAPEATYSETELPFEVERTSDGKEFLCNGMKIEETVVLDKLTLNAFDDRSATNTASLYPGSIIKIKDFVEINDLNGIGGIPRNPIQVSTDLGDIRTVNDPSQRGNVDKAIKEMEEDNPDFAAKVITESTEAYSLEQSMLHIGVDVKYLGNSVKGRFDFEQTLEKHSFVVKFYQVYHTATVGNPATPGDLFDPAVTADDLNQLLSDVGPLGFISEVAYGRMLIGIFTYEGSSFSSSAEIEGKFRKGFLSVDAELDAEASGFFKNSTFTAAILGGDAQEASAVAGSGLGLESIQAAYNFMKAGGSDPTLGVPIQYKIRQLADPSYPTLAISGIVDYDIPNCQALPNHLVIDKLTVNAAPPFDKDDRVWDQNQLIDKFKDPDVFMIFNRYDSDWQRIANYEDLYLGDMKSSDLPYDYDINIPVKESDFNKTHNVQFYDLDEFVLDDIEDLSTNYELMSSTNFSFGSYLRTASNPNPSNPYPTKVEISDEGFNFTLHLKWTLQ